MVCLCIVYTYISRLDKVIVLQVSPIMEAPVSRAYGTTLVMYTVMVQTPRIPPPHDMSLYLDG